MADAPSLLSAPSPHCGSIAHRQLCLRLREATINSVTTCEDRCWWRRSQLAFMPPDVLKTIQVPHDLRQLSSLLPAADYREAMEICR